MFKNLMEKLINTASLDKTKDACSRMHWHSISPGSCPWALPEEYAYMKQIIMDTNFVMLPFMYKVDIFSEIDRLIDFPYVLCILDKTLVELQKVINTQKGKHKAAAKLALELINQAGVHTIPTADGSVDDLLLEQDAIIATQDAALVKRLKTHNKKVIQLRQRKYLILK